MGKYTRVGKYAPEEEFVYVGKCAHVGYCAYVGMLMSYSLLPLHLYWAVVRWAAEFTVITFVYYRIVMFPFYTN